MMACAAARASQPSSAMRAILGEAFISGMLSGPSPIIFIIDRFSVYHEFLATGRPFRQRTFICRRCEEGWLKFASRRSRLMTYFRQSFQNCLLISRARYFTALDTAHIPPHHIGIVELLLHAHDMKIFPHCRRRPAPYTYSLRVFVCTRRQHCC